MDKFLTKEEGSRLRKSRRLYEDLLVTLVMLLLSACIIWDHTKIYKLEKIVDQQQDTIIILRTQLEES